MSTLKNRLIKLAYENPDQRGKILTVLQAYLQKQKQAKFPSSQTREQLWDMTYESLYPALYSNDRFSPQMSDAPRKAWVKFHEAVQKAVHDYLLEPKNAANVNWDHVGFNRHPFVTEERETGETRREYREPDWTDPAFGEQSAPDPYAKPGVYDEVPVVEDYDTLLPDTENFIRQVLEEGSFTFELYAMMAGMGSSTPSMKKLFKDQRQAFKEIKKDITKEYQNLESTLYEDVDRAVEEEKKSYMSNRLDDVFERGGLGWLLYEWQAPESFPDKVKKAVEKLERPANNVKSVDDLKKLHKMVQDLNRMAEREARGADRAVEEALYDVAGAADEAASEVGRLVMELTGKRASVQDEPLRAKLIRLAYENPEHRDRILPLILRSATEDDDSKQTFEESVKNKTFQHPETGNDVSYDSLPAEEKKKVRKEWEGAQEQKEKKPKSKGKSKSKSKGK